MKEECLCVSSFYVTDLITLKLFTDVHSLLAGQVPHSTYSVLDTCDADVFRMLVFMWGTGKNVNSRQ